MSRTARRWLLVSACFLVVGALVLALVYADTKFLAFVIWGIGCFALFSIDLWGAIHSHRAHRDDRSRRDVIEASALWIVAFASLVAIALVLFGPAGTGIRGFATAMALGGFFAYGVIKVTEPPEHDRARLPVDRLVPTIDPRDLGRNDR